MGIFSFFRKQKQRQTDRVSFTDQEVIRVRPDGIAEVVRWNELHEVSIVTTDKGPWWDDIFFLLCGSDEKSGCAVPLSAEGSQMLLQRLQKLPGFNHEAAMNAMGSTTNARYVCWKRNAA